jgi:hypothetical protein
LRLGHDYRADDYAAGAQNPTSFSESHPWLPKVLKDVASEHRVEELVLVRQSRSVEIPLDCDFKARSRGDSTPVHINAMHFDLTARPIATEVPVPAPEVENPKGGPELTVVPRRHSRPQRMALVVASLVLIVW